jgi:lysophospholipase L1-like esterase
MISRGREWAFRALLVVGSAAAVIAGVELWLASFDLAWDIWYQPHPRSERLIRFEPGSAGRVAGAPVRVNDAGYRGPDRSLAKEAGVFRIALLGDSMTFGWAVREEEAFAARLERRLNEALPDARHEVLNFAMIGYNTAQEAEACTLDVLPYAPDLVLLGFFMNDVDPPVRGSRAWERAHTEKPPRDLFGTLRARLDPTRLRAWKLARTRAAALARRAGFAPRGAITQAYAETFAARGPAWRACEEALLAARDATAARGGRFAVVVLPAMVSLDDSYPLRAAHEQVVAFCAGAAIPAIDLLAAFAGQDAARLAATPLDNHMNAAGHAIAAEAIFEWLLAEGLVRERS